MKISRVPAEATYALRQRVLRPNQTLDDMRLPGDDDPQTGIFAALIDGTVIATASVRRQHCPWWPGREDSWCLRGMATEPAYRRQGLGAAVLNALLDHVAANGGGLVWCGVRTAALTLYLRAGFALHGQQWDEPQIGPHQRVWREVVSAEGGDEVSNEIVDRLDADAEADDVTGDLQRGARDGGMRHAMWMLDK